MRTVSFHNVRTLHFMTYKIYVIVQLYILRVIHKLDFVLLDAVGIASQNNTLFNRFRCNEPQY